MRGLRPILLCLAFLASASFAATGRLDMTFGTGGRAMIDFNSPPPRPLGGFDDSYVVAVAPDGKIMVAGSTMDYPNGVPGFPQAAIARLNADGTLDATFGTGGRVRMTFGPCSTACNSVASRPFSFAFQPDGKILLGGVFNGPSRSNVAIVRLNSNGTLDTSFGDAGIASPSMTATSSESAAAMTLLPDGRILVIGNTHEPQPGEPPFTPWRLAMFRLDANGALDPGFGTGGKVDTLLPGLPGEGSGRVLTDGRIQVLSWGGPFGDLGIAIATFSSNGALEASNVINVTQFNNSLGTFAFQPDGKVVLPCPDRRSRR